MEDVMAVPVTPTLERLPGCEEVSVLPEGFRQPAPPAGIAMPNYSALQNGYPDYDAFANDISDPFDNYGDMMRGHPGHEGGLPVRPGGNGIVFGVRDYFGTEWWLTDAEGLTDSPEWEQRSVQPALGDGSWLLDVRASAREVVLKGTLVGTGRAEVVRSLSEGVSALASPPRTGWLQWDPADGTRRRMPVALTGRIKTAWKSARWCEFEVEMLGINIGTPGAGVFMESAGTERIDIRDAVTNTILTLGGAVPSPPTFTFSGPVDPGTVVQLSSHSVEVAQAVARGSTLVVNTLTRRVLLDGAPARSMVRFGGGVWPLMPVGAVPVAASKVGAGSILVEVTRPW